MLDEKLYKSDPKKFFEDMEYAELRLIDGKWFGLYRMAYTTGIICNLNFTGNKGGRLCFDSWASASEWLAKWDGLETPTIRDGLTADKRVNAATNEQE